MEEFSKQLENSDSIIEIKYEHPILLSCDRYWVTQALINLLRNAFKFGNGKSIEVIISSKANHAFLSVQDHGLGIAKEDQSRVFKQFERAVPRNEVSGLGLGLYIVKQIIDAHGGSVSVESEIGEGSCFTVEFPCEAQVISTIDQ